MRKIIVACDAGMFQRDGRRVLRKKGTGCGPEPDLRHQQRHINNLPPDVIWSLPPHLTERAMRQGTAGAAYFADQLPR